MRILPGSVSLCSLWSALLLGLAPAASADWLVSRDGERVETRGPWKVERKLVVFRLPNGTLSSLRLADVDLEASVRATAEARLEPAPPAAPAVPARRASVLVLTTEDVGRAAQPAEPDAERQAAESEVPEDVEAPPVEVISWSQADDPGVGGLEILGTLRNDSPSIVTGAGVRVSLYDHDGELIGRRDAFLDTTSIAGRATTGFRALFPGVEVFEGEPVFEVRGRELELREGAGERELDRD